MKKQLLFAALFLLGGLATQAQHVRLNGYTSYVFDDKVDSYYDQSSYYKGTIKGSFFWGAGIEFSQMLDGMALGETTPGPLIMVVAFVGFMGGWNQGLAAGAGHWALAIAAALVTVWFTFLPSFCFILAGAPLVEASRGDIRLGAPLSAITAVVVGLIGSLAVFFAGPVLWPAGVFNPWALLVAVAALLLQLRLRWSVMQVIGAAAAVGLLRVLLPWWP